MAPGDKVRWEGPNRVLEGTLEKKVEEAGWLVSLPNGKYVIVNEGSFIHV